MNDSNPRNDAHVLLLLALGLVFENIEPVQVAVRTLVRTHVMDFSTENLSNK